MPYAIFARAGVLMYYVNIVARRVLSHTLRINTEAEQTGEIKLSGLSNSMFTVLDYQSGFIMYLLLMCPRITKHFMIICQKLCV